MGDLEGELNLEQLKNLKKIFEEADEDGSGELDIDEFVEKLGPYLGANLSRERIVQLFLKIDADAGGTVDWDEFTNYMFLERAQTGSESESENWRLFPQDFKDKNDPSLSHRGVVDNLVYCDQVDKYISCGRDGTFRVWNAPDLKHYKTVYMGSSWVTDCVFMPMAHKLVFATMDRALSFYETNRGTFELTGRVYASGNMGVPQSLALVTNDAGEQLVYGDSKGCVAMALCGAREWPARDMISTEDHQDYLYIHQEHKDWVTRVGWIPEIGLVSSSMDATLKVYDFVREKVTHTCTHHSKGVHDFVYCKSYSMFASCGQERDVLLWQGNTLRRTGELSGHTSSVRRVRLDERLNHVFTLSTDKVIKVWDLRNHRCLQTISPEDWARPEDCRPNTILYDQVHRRCVAIQNRPYCWIHKMVAQDRTGHMEPIRNALFNQIFSVIVSVDEGGTVCVWDVTNGEREGKFSKAHGSSRVTAATFDMNQRRLLTAANDGALRMWNFNNGSLLREYVHSEEQLELSAVIYAADEKRGADAVYAAGWNSKVFVWEDNDEGGDGAVTEYRTYEGHREDIVHMSALPARQLLAAGDYEGRINIYNLFSGEKRMSLFHRAERYETSVERLLWLTPPAPPAPLASRFSLNQCNDRPTQQPLPKSGSGLGLHPLSTSLSQPQSNSGQIGGGGSVARSSSKAGGPPPPPPPLLLSCGGDGVIRVWLITGTGKLFCRLPGSYGRLEQVTAIAAAADHSQFIVGDSAGHLRVWDVSAGVDTSSSRACRSSFQTVAHWRARPAGISSIDLGEVGGRRLVIAGAKDCSVSIWTTGGALIGIMGEKQWQLKDPSTWQDPKAERTAFVIHRRRRKAGSTADAAALEDDDEEDEDDDEEEDEDLEAELDAEEDEEDEENERTGEGGDLSHEQEREARRKRREDRRELRRQTKQALRKVGQGLMAAAAEEEAAVEASYSAMQRATLLLSERRTKAREAERSRPMGLHSMLKVHDLQEIPDVKDLIISEKTPAASGSGVGSGSGSGSARTNGGRPAGKPSLGSRLKGPGT